MNLKECSIAKSGLIMTPEATLSFPHLFEPQETDHGPKYNAVLIFDDDADLTLLRDAVKEVADKKWPGKKPAGLKNPFRNGEEKMDMEGYGPGKKFFAISGKFKPSMRSADGQRELTAEEGLLYPGCRVRATVDPYWFNKQTKGVAIGLRGIQFLGHGEPLGGGVYDGAEDFDAVEESSEKVADDDMPW